MKKYQLLTFVVASLCCLISLGSCSKEQVSPLIGTWEAVQSFEAGGVLQHKITIIMNIKDNATGNYEMITYDAKSGTTTTTGVVAYTTKKGNQILTLTPADGSSPISDLFGYEENTITWGDYVFHKK